MLDNDQNNANHLLLLRAEIDEPAYRKLIRICTDALPDEACGVLASSHSDSLSHGAVRIDTVYPIRNAAQEKAHVFSFEPREWIGAYFSMLKNRQTLVGFYHSHPLAPPVPSSADIAGIRYSTAMTYWIVSLADPDQPHIQAYQVSGNSFVPLMFAQVSV
ncbi:M67 family metallopeptidase [Paenibacillus spongiae]|uniref:M67 family metallopeptidase n=1 Tax=Paenibacillus spongiae TaxID=2909671 RepID=A0ABY5S3A8_9BACL|nr:M67 family metallopeptidase [Paenibacillus spongiae]UVI28055.1 M67 family metallopeptidase [Paenibacillus spongiae]